MAASIVGHGRAGIRELTVGDHRLSARAGLHEHLVPGARQLSRDLGNERDATLAFSGLLGDSDSHKRAEPYRPDLRRGVTGSGRLRERRARRTR